MERRVAAFAVSGSIEAMAADIADAFEVDADVVVVETKVVEPAAGSVEGLYMHARVVGAAGGAIRARARRDDVGPVIHAWRQRHLYLEQFPLN